MECERAIERGDCLHLLGQSSTGQVAFTARALTAIRSVVYALVGQDLVLDTRSDDLAQQLDGQVVAFAVEASSGGNELNWSVVVTGMARRLTDVEPLPGTFASAVPSGGHGQLVVITNAWINGWWVGSVSPEPARVETARSVESLPRMREPS